MARNYYEILGVSKDATQEDIKKHTESLHVNIILMSIPTTKKPRQNLKKFQKHTPFYPIRKKKTV